jgi:haloalkane dehalogenase
MRTRIMKALLLLVLIVINSMIAETVLAQAKPTSINGETMSAEFSYQSRYMDVLGSKMHYVDEGQGDVVLFIHGNPTSSYLWRNVIPHVSKSYRAIAIDLIGMGKSDKPDIAYTYLDHRQYVEAFIKALDLKNLTFVIHDWGSVLGFDYAMTHESNVKGLAFMEALVPPSLPFPTEPAANTIFGRFRTPGEGEKLIIDENYFVEQMIPSSVIRKLSDAEMNHYRAPYLEPASRKPTLLWPRELPMGGKPAVNQEIILNIGEWMKKTEVPMLYLWAEGRATTADYYVKNVKNIETHYLGPGRHYLQEDHPESIGRAVHDWRRRMAQ